MKKFLLNQPIYLWVRVIDLWGYYPPPIKYSISKGRINFYQKNRLLDGLCLPWDHEDFWTKLCSLWWNGAWGDLQRFGDWTHYRIQPETIQEIYNTLFDVTGRYYEPLELSFLPSKQPTLSVQEIHSILGLS